jgi:hypothetical protein
MAAVRKPLLDEGDAIPQVSLIQEKLIGRVVVQWSKIEAGLNELIWRFLRISIEEGRVLTGRMDAQTKIPMVRKLAPNYIDGKLLEDLIKALELAESIRDDRNFIVHGTWCTLTADGVALSVSLRGKAAPGEMKAERFPHERMRTIVRDIFLVKDALIKVTETLPPLREI